MQPDDTLSVTLATMPFQRASYAALATGSGKLCGPIYSLFEADFDDRISPLIWTGIAGECCCVRRRSHRLTKRETHAGAVAFSSTRHDSRNGDASAGWRLDRKSDRLTRSSRRERFGERPPRLGEKESEAIRPDSQVPEEGKGASNQRVETTSIAHTEIREGFPCLIPSCSVSHS